MLLASRLSFTLNPLIQQNKRGCGIHLREHTEALIRQESAFAVRGGFFQLFDGGILRTAYAAWAPRV